MGRAGKALKHTLDTYGISQYSVAVALGIERGSVYRWVHEQRDPTAETVVEIVRALRGLNPAAAETFVQRYLGNVASGIEVDPEVEPGERETDRQIDRLTHSDEP